MTLTRLIVSMLLIVSLTSFAENTNILVTHDWLAQQLDDPNLVILHVGTVEDYNQAHIPGARQVHTHMDLSNPNSHTPENLILELPEIAQLESKLESLGISNNSTIVIYWTGNTITDATRALFTLDWAGLGEQSHLLDGGLDAWKRASLPTTTERSTVKLGKLTLSARPDMIVDADWIQAEASKEGYALVDARAQAFYDGINNYHSVLGHIEGAGNAPWPSFFNADIKLQNTETLRDLLTNAGVKPGDTVVGYCHIGQYATLVLMAARMLGHEVKLYDGAFQDWAARGLPGVTNLPPQE